MKSTKTFNEMCNYIHELLTSLGYTYMVEADSTIFRYFLGDYEMLNIFNSSIAHKSIWKKEGFESPWYEVETNKAGEYESNCINQFTNYAKNLVKLYKQKQVDSRIKEIKKDFQDG